MAIDYSAYQSAIESRLNQNKIPTTITGPTGALEAFFDLNAMNGFEVTEEFYVTESLNTFVEFLAHEISPGKAVKKDVKLPEESSLKLSVELHSRKIDNSRWLFTIILRNTSPVGEVLYQTYFRARLKLGRIRPYPESQRPYREDDHEENSIALLYKDSRIWGIGHGCACGWNFSEEDEENINRIGPDSVFADVLPGVELPSMTPDIVDSDGKEIKLYVDGELIGNKAIAGELYNQSRQPMSIGSYKNGSYERESFHGGLNDIRVFRSGLSQSQVKELKNGNKEVALATMVGSWRTEVEEEPQLSEPVEKIAHERIEKFLYRAFRSPPDEKTLSLYTKYFDKSYKESGDFTASMKSIVSGAMASPRFIMVHDEASEASSNFDSYSLASRLSFFLWCSIPDEELLQLAEQGSLQDPQILAQQVDRMLNDRRVKNFCDSFAPQWLKINNIVSASPDFKLYRDYYFGGDDKISYKRGMHMMLETLLNFETVFIENRPIMELIDADFTYRSHLLEEWYEGRAATYPINVNLRDINFTRKPLTDRRYGGVITTGAVMVMTSGPFRSHPITRGSWVSSVIFNDPPKPPPDDIPDLIADDSTLKEQGLTVRQKLKQHSKDVQCSGCHQKIDPLGFALENFDLLGRWRDNYRTGIKVDASGKLFGKHSFEDVVGFKDAILAEKDVFANAFIRHLLSFALGRELTLTDRIAADEITRASKQDNYQMREIIKHTVLHPIFNLKRES